MSIERVERQGGAVWRVRWRESGTNRSKVVGRKRDAEAFDAEVRRRLRLGEVGLLDAGKPTLAEFSQEWWRRYAVPTLVPKTRAVYATLWDKHILPVLGGYRLCELTPEHVEELHARLVEKGLAPGSARKCLAILQGVLQRAVLWGRIPANPAARLRKPRAESRRRIRALAPSTVEAIRSFFLNTGRFRDATVVSVLAYSGLRPGEMRGLTWGHVGERTLHVEQAVSSNVVGPTKTRRARTVRLLAALAADLKEWKVASGVPADDTFVFPNVARNGNRRGQVWTDRGWNGWQQEHFAAATEAAGVPSAVAYDLRHSFVSLLIQEGVSILDVARQAGHSPTLTLERYGHLFDEIDPADRTSAEEAIKAARAKSVSVSYLSGAATQKSARK